jgi:putative tryptophan/tyrosine transport system substrate-binding protein
MMRRREFITLLGGAAATWPLMARAQQPTMPVIGFLNGASAWEYSRYVEAFRHGLSETGYSEGRNVFVEYRWAEGHYERLPTLAGDLVRRRVAVIVANGPSIFPAKEATTTIPIVFQTASDPVASGLVASLDRPGGNLTGAVNLGGDVMPKRMELLHELVPSVTTMVFLTNPTNRGPLNAILEAARAAARTLGLQLHVAEASSERDFDTVFARLPQLGAGALVIGNDAFLTSRSEQLASLALRYALPTVGPFRNFTEAGGLMSYGSTLTDTYSLVGTYAGRILKGEKPADLPVQQVTRIELIINLKTAKALGLTVPPTTLVTADEVIE